MQSLAEKGHCPPHGDQFCSRILMLKVVLESGKLGTFGMNIYAQNTKETLEFLFQVLKSRVCRWPLTLKHEFSVIPTPR